MSSGRLTYLIGFPLIMIVMLYLSALLGIKWQGTWLESPMYALIKKTPRSLRLVVSSLAGAITPFCSCTTVPGFAAILEADLGLDTAMTFLIASPTIDPAGTLLLLFLFGAKLTALYVFGCFISSIAGGWIIGRFFTSRDVNPVLLFGCAAETDSKTWSQAASAAWEYIYRFWWVILLSTLVGFVLYDYVPVNLVVSSSEAGGFLAVPLAALLGVFVYAHMAVLFPVGAALLGKGMAPGIVIAFLASSAGISPPEILLLRKIVSLRLTISYILVTVVLISVIGYIVNWVGR